MQKVSAQLGFIEPMDCKEVRRIEDIPRGVDWQYELKFDGYRCIAVKSRGEIQLFSRRGLRFRQFPNLHGPLNKQAPQAFIVDGEIVAVDETGKPAFSALQRAQTKPIDVQFYVFDLLNLEGKSLLDFPLTKRQRMLWNEFVPGGVLHPPGPLDAELDVIIEQIRRLGFEGVVAKQCDSIYTPGRSPGSWVKKKLKQSDEFIIGGFEPGAHGLDEIVVGRYAGKDLKYVALVDDGFVPATRRQVFDAIKNLKTQDCPFTNVPEKKGFHKLDREKMRKLTWVKPKVVVEIAMNEWTPDRHLRHSEFKKLRPDKSPKEVSPYPGKAGT